MPRTLRRRRKEGKTDYKARLSLLKSEKPRIVVRKTNMYIISQVVVSENAQDRVIAKVSSKELLKTGWPSERAGSLKSLAACYLTGYLLGISLKDKIKEAVLDIGLYKGTKGSRIYAVLKGFLDAGISVPCSAEILSQNEKLKNPLTEKIKQKIKEGIKQ